MPHITVCKTMRSFRVVGLNEKHYINLAQHIMQVDFRVTGEFMHADSRCANMDASSNNDVVVVYRLIRPVFTRREQSRERT